MRRTITLLATLLWTLTCAPPDVHSPEADAPAVETGPALPPEGVVAAADGVEIAFEARGSGETTLLFVHCWACDREFWRGQIEAFSDRYQTVAVDLPGHGASGADREDWSIADLARDVESLAKALDLERIILVGHSMGGPVSLLATPLMPDRVVGVVLVDTVHDAEALMHPEDMAQIIDAYERDFEGTNRQFVPMMFPPGADPETVEWVIERANATDQRAAKALMADYPNLVPARILGAAQVPVRAVNAAALPPLIPATAIEANRRYADYDAALLDGVGHYLMLEKPAAFNALLRTAIEQIDGS